MARIAFEIVKEWREVERKEESRTTWPEVNGRAKVDEKEIYSEEEAKV